MPVLFHPAVTAFVSHGGMGSTNEGFASGKPILCIPFLADQFINAQHVANTGHGLRLLPQRWESAYTLARMHTHTHTLARTHERHTRPARTHARAHAPADTHNRHSL